MTYREKVSECIKKIIDAEYERGKEIAIDIAGDVLVDYMDCFECPANVSCREGKTCKTTLTKYLETKIKEAEQ